MLTVSIDEAKERLAELIDLLPEIGEVTITDNSGRPVARLVGVEEAAPMTP